MMKKQMLAIFIVVVAVSGLGFAMTPAITGSNNKILKIFSNSDGTSKAAADSQAAISAEFPLPSIAYPTPADERPQILVFKGVAVKDNTAYPAAFLAFNRIDSKNSYYNFQYSFVIIGGEVTPLAYQSSTFDSDTNTLIVIFTSPQTSSAAGTHTFIFRWYQGTVFLSGNFGGYMLNMNLVGYPQIYSGNYPQTTKPVKTLPYDQGGYAASNGGSTQISQDSALKIAQSVAAGMK